MGWVREWEVTIETDDRRSLPGRGPTRQVTVGSVPDLKRLVLAARADPAIRTCRYAVRYRLDAADQPTHCASCQREFAGPWHQRARTGWVQCVRCPGHATFTCIKCAAVTIFPAPSYDCGPALVD